ncbi:ankyrin repeat domain-containing protein SOWAHB isoform X2 [Esox lucius]|uniref:ankyrin repeat domain-containing protein SOWAHB isoform X2 n=1 Tax=Esox lucius TaxID=8010 RepID=UPI00097329AD|nr:ankyrin repeat domain-containing protein SOWAHB isoform X2 [Esox lucius]
MMGDVSEESLLDYFYSAGGKVKNAELMKTYKPFIGHNDMQLRAKYREEFKQIIDRIAVVKSENGEKYLVLKKRYRQQKQDSEPDQRIDRPSSSAQWDGPGFVSLSRPQSEPDLQLDPAREARSPSITVTEAPEQEQEDQCAEMTPSLSEMTPSPSEITPSPSFSEEPHLQSNREDELEKESGSKSESEEQEEECTGSMGSTPVALDPVEKEWIYSAACGCLSDLTQLLKQEPSLANKKDFTSTALHWAAKHGKEDMATMMANAGADVNTKSHGGYTPLHIAALHGHRHILELLIGTYGAKENVRDYSGHLACHYLNIREAPEDMEFAELHVAQARERSRNRKLPSLFQSKKKWGSAEDLAPVEEERLATAPHQLLVPAFRPRKFSR